MPDRRINENVLRRAAAAALPTAPVVSPDDPTLEQDVVDSLRIRGVSSEVVQRLANLPGGQAAIWSKTYTENASNRLINPVDGSVIYQTDVPLTQAELDLINRLGIQR